MIAEKKGCKGNYTWGGNLPSLSACGTACEKNSLVFGFGRKDGERVGHCWCYTDSLDGKCSKGEKDEENYDIYLIKREWNILIP